MKKWYNNPKSLVFEELEPRLLFSADGAEALAVDVVEQDFEEEPVLTAQEEVETEANDVAADNSASEEIDAASSTTADDEESTDQEITGQETFGEQSEETVADSDTDTNAASAEEDDGAVTTVAAGEENETVAPSETELKKELVLVNDNVQDYETLITDVEGSEDETHTIEVLVLDHEESGIDQVSSLLSERNDLDAIHIITHADANHLYLGASALDADSIDEQYFDQLTTIGESLAENGDILIYGCDFGSGEAGMEIVDRIARVTGADVAASNDPTGHDSLGGDWDLEVTNGPIEAEVVISQAAQEEWEHLLANTAPTFNTVADFTTHILAQTANSSGPNDVSLVDMDGDGDLDALVAAQSDSNLLWYENNGAGGFTEYLIVPQETVFSPLSAVAGDIDGDGDMDVLSASSSGDEIFWFENDGNQSFTPHSVATSVDRPTAVALADLNADGHLDLVATLADSNTIVWYENNGDKTFTSHNVTTTANEPEWVHITDLDGDGYLDILSGSSFDTNINWYRNNNGSPGNFSADTIATSGSGTTEIDSADLDGDGNLDLVAASKYDDTLIWYDGSENFTEHAVVAIAYDAGSAHIADVDGDGDLDVLSTLTTDDAAVWYENDGNESFTGHTLSTDVYSGASITTGDLDGDGLLDIVVASSTWDQVLWFENTTHSTLDANKIYVGGDDPVILDADVDIRDAELDALNGGLGNYSGAELSLVQAGDSSASAVFSFLDGNGITLSGNNLIKNEQVMATFQTIVPGFLYITFTDAGGEIPTSADVDNILRQIAYSNTSGTAETVEINWYFSDGDGTDPLVATGSTIVDVRLPFVPMQTVPGAQTVDEDQVLTFSTVNSNAVTVSDTIAGTDSFLQVTLSVNDGVLNLFDLTGITVVAGAQNSESITFSGTESDINAALEGMTFTPNADFSGTVTLNMTTALSADLAGHYTFEGGNAEDKSAGTSYDGVLTGDASIVIDGERGEVLTLDRDGDYVEISSMFGESADVTLAAWINVDRYDINGSQVISLGGNVFIWLKPSGVDEIRAAFYDGSSWQQLNVSGVATALKGTGWHHIAYTIDDSTELQTLYLDGESIGQTTYTQSISYTAPNIVTRIGAHTGDLTGRDFDGLIDDVRIYSRALSADEILALERGTTEVSDTVAINVISVNDAPVINLDPTNLSGGADDGNYSTTFTEGDTAVALTTANLTVTDADNTSFLFIDFNIESIVHDGSDERVNIGGHEFVYGSAEYVVVTFGGTTFGIDYDGAESFGINKDGGGEMPAADVEAFLKTVTYKNVSQDPTAGDRIFSIAVHDATASSSATSTVSVLPVNDPSAIDLNGVDGDDVNFAVTFTEDDSAINIVDFDASISDPDNSEFVNLDVNLTNFVDGASEQITIGGHIFYAGLTDNTVVAVGGSNFELDFDGSGFNIMPSGAATMPLSDLQTLLRSISYENTSENPTIGDRTIVVRAVDADGLAGATATSIITVAAVNNAPVISSPSGTYPYTEGDGLVILGGSTTVSDSDSADFDGGEAVYQLTANGSSDDRLDIATAGSISVSGTNIYYEATLIASYNGPVSGSEALVITFNAAADVAAVQATMRNFSFENTSENPDTSVRTIEAYLTDGDGGISNTLSGTISVTAVNDAPVNLGSLPTDILVQQDISSALDLSVIDISDVDADSGNVSLQLSTSTGGIITAASGSGIIFGNNGSSQITLNGSLSDLNAYLNDSTNVQYLHGTPGTWGDNADTVEVSVNDLGNTGTGGGINVSLGSINIDINAAPAATDDSYTAFEGTPYTAVLSVDDVLLNDNDVDGDPITVSTTPVSGPSNGQLVLNADGSFTYTPNAGFNGTDSFTYEISDDRGGTAQATATITVLPRDIRILFATNSDISNSKVPGLDTWETGEVLAVADPNLMFEPAGSDGSILGFMDLESFSADDEMVINGLHFVSNTVTVGSSNAITLQHGDVLFSAQDDESMSSSNDLEIAAGDIIVFRPDSAGDYSSGTFTHLLDQPGTSLTTGITLIEGDVTIGDVTLDAGTILFTQDDGSANIYHFTADDAGAATTGTTSVLIDGADLGLAGENFIGLMIVTEDLHLPGTVVPTGAVITSISGNNISVGSNNLTVKNDEIIYLTVNTTTMESGTTVADATLLYDTGDIGLNNINKKIRVFTLIESVLPPNEDPIITLSITSLNYTEGDPPTIIDPAATLTDSDSLNFNDGLLRIDLAATGTGNDRLAINNEGTSAGQIGISGNDVTYGGVVIGIWNGGDDGFTPLTVQLNANADQTSVEALIRNITYENVSSDPSENQRQAQFSISDGDGGSSEIVQVSIVVNGDNTAPVLSGANDLDPINEDFVTNPGTLVSDLVSGWVSDVDPASTAGIAVIDVDNTNGTWQFSIDGGTNWTDFGSPSCTDVRLLAGDANTYVRFVPNQNWNGMVTNGITFHAWDQTSGVNGDNIDMTAAATIRDEFNSVTYSANDGTGVWTSAWIEVNDDGSASTGNIRIENDKLHIDNHDGGSTEYIYRSADLSDAVSATLTLDFDAYGGGTTDTVTTGVSIDGGLTWIALREGYIIGNSSGTRSMVIEDFLPLTDNMIFRLGIVSGMDAPSEYINFDNIDITWTGGGSGGSSSISTATASSSITVNPINDNPYNDGFLPSAITVTEDVASTITLGGFTTLADVDAGSSALTLTLSTSTGGNLTAAAGTGITIGGNGTTTLTLTGNLTDLNAYHSAGNITYLHSVANTSGYAADTIQVDITDNGNTGTGGGGTITLGTFDVDITAVNDAPILDMVTGGFTYYENATGVLVGTSISISDPDSVDFNGGTLTTTVSNNGTADDRLTVRHEGTGAGQVEVVGSEIYIDSQLVATFTGGNGYTDSLVISFTGNAGQTEVQAIAERVNFSIVGDDPSDLQRTVGMILTDGDGGTSAADSVVVNIIPMNDAPVVSAPAGPLTVTEQAWMNFEGAGFSVSDVDDQGGNLTATLNVIQGDITVSTGDSGVAIISDDGNGTVVLEGTVSELNSLFEGTSSGTLAYRHPSQLPPASVILSLTVNDQGNTGNDPGLTGDAASEEGSNSVVINITSVNDAPKNTVPGIQTVLEETSTAISGISIQDADVGTNNLTTRLQVSNGVLHVTLSGSASISAGADNSNDLTIQGNVTDINATLATLMYTGDTDVTGVAADTLTVTTNDLGNTGTGGNLSDVDTVQIDVTDVNDGPTGTTLVVAADEETATAIDISGNVSDIDGTVDLTTTTVTGGPSNGSLVNNNDGTFTYTGNIDFTGTDSFTYTVEDNDGQISSDITVTINVSDINDAPTGTTLVVAADEETATAIDISGNVSDVDGTVDLATTTVTGGPANGSLINNNDGTFTYTGNVDFVGTDSFTYTVEDNDGQISSDITVTINVSDINDAPTGTILVVAANEETATAIDISANVSDVDGTVDLTTTTVTGGPANGSLINHNNGTFTYTGNADFVGTDSFTYTVEDNDGQISSDITVTINVSDINDAPTGTTLVVAADEETATAIDISGNVSDVDGTVDLSTTAVTGGPANGSLINHNNGTFTYTGNIDFTGTDSFTYTVEDNDGQVSSDITVTINVSNINDAPTGTTLVVAADEETATAIDISGNVSDVDGTVDLTTTTVTGGPTNGTLVNHNDGTFTYTGNADFVGTDSFTYTVEDNDGQVSSDITVTINVSDINDAPAGTTLVVAADEETATAINISGNVSDVDGTVNLTTTTVTGGPSNGSLVNNNDGTFTYTGNIDFTGTDSFTYTVEDNDGQISSDITVTINVSDINDAPTGTTLVVAADEETATAIDISGNVSDVDGTVDLTTTTVTNGPSNGTLINNNDGTFTYTGNVDFVGTDSFTYTVENNDGQVSSDITVTINVSDINDAPTGTTMVVAANEESATIIDISGNVSDVDGTVDLSTTAVTSGPANGTLINNNDGTFTYTGDIDFVGTDSFTYTVEDNDGQVSSDITVTINVSDINDAPTGTTMVVAANEESATIIDISGNVSDVDGTVDLSTTAVTSGPANGTLINNNDGTFTYTGDIDFVGTDSFTYTVEDNDGQVSSDITVTINVSDINDAPAGTTLVVAADEETATAINISGNVSDIDGTVDLTTTTVTGGPSNGSLLNNNDGTFTYTGNIDFTGTDSFTYTVQDNDGQVSSDITVTINVSDLNDAPTIESVIPDQNLAEDFADYTIDLNSIFADVETSDANLLYSVSGNSNIGVSISAGIATISSTANWNGSETIIFTAEDESGATVNASVAFIVAPQNDAPTVSAVDLGSIDEGGSRLINQVDLLAGSGDAENDSLGAVNLTSDNGSLADNHDGTWIFTPAADWNGTVNFTFDVSDGTMATVNTASLTITAINVPEDEPAVEETDPNENEEVTEDTTVPDTPDPTDPTDPEESDPEEPPVITVVDDDGTVPMDDDETVAVDDDIIPYSDDENTDPIVTPSEDDGAEESIDDSPLDDDADKSIPTTTFSLPDAAEEHKDGPIDEISADSPIALSSRHDGQQTRPVGLRMAREFLLQSNKFQLNQYDAILRPSAPTVADFLSYANSADFEIQKIMIAQEIENLHQEMDRTYNEDKFDRNVALYVGSGVSVTFTAGTAAYLLRSGSLLSSFIVSMPLWKGFDPVAVLMYPKKKKKDQRESSDMQEHMFSGHNEHPIENMFHDSNER